MREHKKAPARATAHEKPRDDHDQAPHRSRRARPPMIGGGYLANGPSQVKFSAEEAGTITGDREKPRDKLENPTIEQDIVGGAHGMERREEDDDGFYLGGAGDAVDKVATLTPGVEVPGLPAAQLPAILHLIERGDYSGAGLKMATSIAPTEYMEAYEFLVSRFGAKVAEKCAESLLTGGAAGAAANTLTALVMWSYEGLKSIGEAHEQGDRDSRIAIYASAFADAFLSGSHSNPGALTREQREAMAKGVEAGQAAAARLGENGPAIGRALVAKYGSANNVKHALVDQLMENAGIRGVKTHEGGGTVKAAKK